jgi:aminopeptidase N
MLKFILISLSFFFSLSPLSLHASELIHHDLNVILTPTTHQITVVDSITLARDSTREVTFLLHSGLGPTSSSPLIRVVKEGRRDGAVPLDSYRATLPPGLHSFSLSYAGTIYHPLEKQGGLHPRGFQETPGTISDAGVYLSGDSGWYPDFGSKLMTFDLEVKMPESWDAVSQGERTRHSRGALSTLVHWKSLEPQESIYLVAGTFTQYTRPSGPLQAMVFLRSPDKTLADKYLNATVRYISMYNELLGPYPYKKFALVENFWETGFGMPSFTLLGPTVIRLPFIINTSYPHEILHNWWGNSVYPIYEKGNWSEGITAYLADHLMREQQGAGAEYRITTLQKYADYVRGGKDFPLTQFRSRHDPATEAVGYGKALMFFHMLRNELGDPAFTRGLREFYWKYKFHYASFDDIKSTFEAVSGKDLNTEFKQWVTWTGAPQLQVGKVSVGTEGDKYYLSASIKQVQAGKAYRLLIPIAITLKGQEQAFQTTVGTESKKAEIKLFLPSQPLRLDIDPEFDLFRRLDREEIPPAISQVLGSKKMLIVLPSNADQDLLNAYRTFAQSIARSGPDEVAMKLDNDINELPVDHAIMVIGWENRFADQAFRSLSEYIVTVNAHQVQIGKASVPRKNHSFVLTSRLPGNRNMPLCLIATDDALSLTGLANKLPHYHKYSYLAFKGLEPSNVAKGRWPVETSPLTVYLPEDKDMPRKVEMGKLAPREPLARLDLLFSRERMMKTVRYLSSDKLAGRGFGSEGLDKAAGYIAKQFKKAGLLPAGDKDNGYFQTWGDTGGATGHRVTLRNVIGVIIGRNEAMKSQSVVVGAHYDHLGLGWPETGDPAPGKIHPGADDNASGVSVLIELANVLAKGQQPERTIVFVAFSGEESGRRGSKYYAANEKRFPLRDCIGMVNLDTVGRLGKNKLLVLGTDSSKEWVHIFQGAGFVSSVDIDTISAELDSSDQKSFQEAGVPAVQLFSGPNTDYHRSTDTVEKIDADGLVKVASVAKEAVAYLAEREHPLTTEKASVIAGSSAKTERKVSMGTIPDFSYEGNGFRLSGVVAGSPAEAAALKEGDIIVKMNGTTIEGLKDFSDILKTLHPGDKASIVYLRDGKELFIEVEVRAR